MARHIEAWMDGVRLSDIGPIMIQGVQEPSPDMEITYGSRPLRDGQDILIHKRRGLKITIECVIRELYDLSKRTIIEQAIAGWASGSILELSNHPGQRLHVTRRMDPGLGAVRNYANVIRIELEASEIPFWEDKSKNTFTGTSGTSGEGMLFVPGTAERIPVDASFTPVSGTLTALTVTVSCGGVTRSIQLTGMSVTGAVVISHDEHDRLKIMSGTTSLLRYRTQTSADDLIVPHGLATVTWTANVSVSASFGARGRWL